MRGKDAAVARDEGQIVLRHLPLPALAAYLNHGLRDRGHAPHVEARQLPAARVDGEPSPWSGHLLRHERAALALGTEPVVLERDDHREGVAVVELGEVQVRDADARHAEGGLAGEHGAGGERVGGAAAQMPLPHAPAVAARLAQAPRTLAPRAAD